MPKVLTFNFLCWFILFVASAQLRTPENVPISFYGKAVDQHDEPVTGGKVNFVIGVVHGREEDADTHPIALTTDDKGCFSLVGSYGYAIDGLSIAKAGYSFSQKNRNGFIFGFMPDYVPDPINPVIFKMWKQSGKEPLISSSWHGKVACDGTTNKFDLSSGHLSTDGGLQIVCTRTPLNFQMTSRQPFDYKMDIAISGGGIQPTQHEFTYLAPENGYSPNLTIDRRPGDPKWGGGLKQEFYIKTTEGHYGRLSVEWDAGHRPSPTLLKWDSTINPSGSRNLER